MPGFGKNSYRLETKKETSQLDRAPEASSSYDPEREANKAAKPTPEQIQTAYESLTKVTDESLVIQRETAVDWLKRYSYLQGAARYQRHVEILNLIDQVRMERASGSGAGYYRPPRKGQQKRVRFSF